MTLIIPERLKKGETIGFISPSAGPHPKASHRINQAKKSLEHLGYKVAIAKNALKSESYVSSSVEERVQDIHDMFLDPEVKMVMCTIGGNNSNQLLKYINYDLIRNNPKIFIGYSDITVLHYALMTQANLATFCGPCAMTQFGEFPDVLDYTLKYFNLAVTQKDENKSYKIEQSNTWTEEFLDWFQKKDQERPRKLNSNTGYEWLVKGKSEGEILGGTILSLNHLVGTKYWRDPKDTIFFLDILQEDGSLDEVSIDAFLTDFDNQGLFDSIKGLIVGRFANCTAELGERIRGLIIKLTEHKGYPVLFNANVGHVDPIITLRYGSKVSLDSSENKFEIV